MTGQQYPTREQIAEVRSLIEKHQPEEWEDDREGGGSGVGCSYCADLDSQGELGDTFPCSPRRDLDAVFALFSQPTPSAEPTAWEQAAQIAERDAGGVTLADLTQFPAVQSTGARIAFNIRAAAQKNGPAAADVLQSQGHHPKATVLGVNEGSLVADMAPGTRFTGSLIGEQKARHFAVPEPLFRWWVIDTATTLAYAISGIDPSTIRDVTPPPATPEAD